MDIWKRNRPVPEIRFAPLNPRAGEPGEFRVLRAEVVIGSGEENQFVIRRPSVSHRHASLAFRKDHYEIADLGSTNGTFVNGRRIKGVMAVKLGDEIRLGDAAFILARPPESPVRTKPVLARKVLTLRAACEIGILTFAIGFGVAEYLAYLEYHARNRLILAEAVPVPAPGGIEVPASVSPPPVKAKPRAIQSAPPKASSPAVSPKTIVEANAPKPVIAGADLINAKELAGSVALANLISGSGTAAGSLAPDFTLTNLDGTEATLGAMRGKIVLLNFWATGCPSCRRQMPSLEQLYHDFRSNPDFTLLTVNIDQNKKSVVAEFIEENGYDFPVLLDPGNATSAAYHVNGIPSNFVIGRDGRILWNCAGGLDWSDSAFRSALNKLL